MLICFSYPLGQTAFCHKIAITHYIVRLCSFAHIPPSSINRRNVLSVV